MVLNGNATSDGPGVHLIDFRHVSYRVPATRSARAGAVLEDSV